MQTKIINALFSLFVQWIYIYTLRHPRIVHHQSVHCILAVASVTIDIERRVVDVIESQHSAEVCLVKSGTTLNTIIAVIATDEITDNVGSPRESSLPPCREKILKKNDMAVMH